MMSKNIVNIIKISIILLFINIFFMHQYVDAKLILEIEKIKFIYIKPPFGSGLQKSIDLLKEGMRRLYGLNLEIVTDPQRVPQATQGFILGSETALALDLAQSEEIDNSSPGGHIFKTEAGKIVIAGNTEWDTYFGVVTFLESLGVKFFGPTLKEAKWPAQPRRQIPAIFKVEKPKFYFRPGFNQLWRTNTCEHADPHKGADSELFDRKLTGSDLWIDHTAGYLVPKLLYYDQHQEYYAQLGNGKRIAKTAFTDHRTPLCLSNPEVTKISIQRALKWVAKEPDKNFFNITYGDTNVWCQCPGCRSLDPVPGQYASRLLHWVNPIARAIREQFPRVIVRTFAYSGTDQPPTGIIPESNVWIILAVELANVPFWDHAVKLKDPILARNLAKIKEWHAVAPSRLSVCEYQGGTYNPAFLQTMASRLRFYAVQGVKGIAYRYGEPLNFKPIFNYVFAKLLWDPNIDAQAAANEFIECYYKTAAPAIKKYLKIVEKRYQETLKTTKKLRNLYPPDFYHEVFVAEALSFFHEAQKALIAYPNLKKELKNEEKYFLEDLISHLPESMPDKIIISYCDRLREIYFQEKQYITFSRKIETIMRDLESREDGERFRPLIGGWLASLPNMQPKIEGSPLKYGPDQLLWGDAGPTRLLVHLKNVVPIK